MRWLLIGCCGLALVSLSVAMNTTQLLIAQRPRFCGVVPGKTVRITCLISPPQKLSSRTQLEWYKVAEYDMYPADLEKVELGKKIRTHDVSLLLFSVETEFSGVYYCKFNGTWGPGSELEVYRFINLEDAAYKSRVKDGLIILQGLLLATCVAVVMLRNQRLFQEHETIYEEPETDHIYEGLAIESCGGGLYEDISVYAQADGAEAPWEQD